MEISLTNLNSSINKIETIEYKTESNIYVITLRYNKNEIIININNSKPFLYFQFEKKI